jgi:hypothetical protein
LEKTPQIAFRVQQVGIAAREAVLFIAAFKDEKRKDGVCFSLKLQQKAR